MNTPTEKQGEPKNRTSFLAEQTTEPAVPRLAFSMKETAEILGVCYLTVWNLVQRGKLRANRALRTPRISRAEIERFLAS